MTKKFVLFLVVGGLLCVMAMPVAAESFKIKADIPFAFMVGGKTMPAGEYTVDDNATISQAVLKLTDVNSNAGIVALTKPMGSYYSDAQALAKLVFHRYGNQYFLYQVWDGLSTNGLEIPQSRQERNMAKETAGIQPENVVILAMR